MFMLDTHFMLPIYSINYLIIIKKICVYENTTLKIKTDILHNIEEYIIYEILFIEATCTL